MSNYREQVIDQQLKKNQLKLYNLPLEENEANYILSKDTSYVSSLLLDRNSISNSVLLMISKGQWNRLALLQLSESNLGNIACKYLSRMQTPKIETLRLNANNLSTEGMLHLSKAQWGTLIMMDFYQNRLVTGSIRHLCKANLKKMKRLSIDNNRIPAYELNKVVLLQIPEILQFFTGYNLRILRESQNIKNSHHEYRDMRFSLGLSL